MKVKSGYILREVAGNYIVVAVGEEAMDFNGLITTNETGAFLWNKLSENISEQELVDAMLEEYEIDKETAASDISAFIFKLKESELLINE